MQLSPLQSRLAASVIATCLLIALYFTLFSPRFALAAELDQINPIILDADDDESTRLDVRAPFDPTYEPEFSAFDRSFLGRRATLDVLTLTNNVVDIHNVNPGMTQPYVFQLSSLTSRRERGDGPGGIELRSEYNESQEQAADVAERSAGDGQMDGEGLTRRATTRTVYISANTCLQPQLLANVSRTSAASAPQLTLYVSTSSSNTSPGPSQSVSATAIPFTGGAVMYSLTTSSDIYLGVYAPNLTTSIFDSNGMYNVEVAASVDGWFHSYDVDADANLIWVDSDSQGALLMTHNLTQDGSKAVDKAIMATLPYVLFAQNLNDTISIQGLNNSYCGLKTYAHIASTANGQDSSLITTGMTQRGQGHHPKQQFYLSGLNSSSTYLGFLAMDGNTTYNGTTLSRRASSTVGGGGHVFRATNFSTMSTQTSCQIISNLSFCDQISYSVPGNPSNFATASDLANWYDSSAKAQYQFFNYSLQQIACEAPPEQRYSLARGCHECAEAYKNWLCSVMIPRCDDFSSNATYLQPRRIYATFPDNTTLPSTTLATYPNISAYTASRNALIDQWVAPGPYQEVLPCDDLCYNLVQSCPASMGFGCPTPGTIGYNTSYGQRTADLSCNYPGSAHVSSLGIRNPVPWTLLGSVLALAVYSL